MILPDSRCEIHGEEVLLSKGMERGKPRIRRYCLSCHRDRERERHGGLKRNSSLDPRCKNGHPKTPFNYGMYGGKKRCIVCAKERGRHKR